MKKMSYVIIIGISTITLIWSSFNLVSCYIEQQKQKYVFQSLSCNVEGTVEVIDSGQDVLNNYKQLQLENNDMIG